MQWRPCFSLLKSGTPYCGSVDYGKTPEMWRDGGWPVVLCQNEHGSCAFTEISNSFFCFAALMVSVNCTKGDLLVSCSTGLLENFGRKDSIVAVVVSNADGVTVCVAFVRNFACKN